MSSPVSDSNKVPASGEQPSLGELPNGFRLEGNAAVCDFKVNNTMLRITVPLSNKKDAQKLLASFDDRKKQFMGEIAIAAGLGQDAVAVNFKRNESGECTEVEKRLQDGTTRKIDSNYFKEKRVEISYIDTESQQVELEKLESLEESLKVIQNLFKFHAFKGANVSEQKEDSPKNVQDIPKGSTDDARMNELKDSVLEKTKPTVQAQTDKTEAQTVHRIQTLLTAGEKTADMYRDLLIKGLGQDTEVRKLIDEFVDKKLETVSLEKFINELNSRFPEKNIKFSNEIMARYAKSQKTVVDFRNKFEREFKAHFGDDEFSSWIKFKNDHPAAKIEDYQAQTSKEAS